MLITGYSLADSLLDGNGNSSGSIGFFAVSQGRSGCWLCMHFMVWKWLFWPLQNNSPLKGGSQLPQLFRIARCTIKRSNGGVISFMMSRNMCGQRRTARRFLSKVQRLLFQLGSELLLIAQSDIVYSRNLQSFWCFGSAKRSAGRLFFM